MKCQKKIDSFHSSLPFPQTDVNKNRRLLKLIHFFCKSPQILLLKVFIPFLTDTSFSGTD